MKQFSEVNDGASQTKEFQTPESQNKALLSPKDFRIRKPVTMVIKPLIVIEETKPDPDPEFNFDDLRIGKKVGGGAFGDVYVGFVQGKFVAVKQLNGQLRESVENEIEILSKLKHKNIVKYYGYKKEPEHLNLYLEFMDGIQFCKLGGSLSDRLKQFGKFNEALIRKFTIQILDGLIYLHSQGVVHRDLKCANILSNQRGQIKLADFGASQWKDLQQGNLSDTEFCQSLKGSFKWMAPELLLKEKKYGRRVDVWSLGCVIIEMATAEHPWYYESQFRKNIKTLAQLLDAIQSVKCPPIPADLSNECQSFIRLCCTYKKEARPISDKLRDHPWIKK